MPSSFATRRARRRFVHRKLVFRLRMFAVVFTVLLGVVLYHVVAHGAQLLPAVESALLGGVVGALLGRVAKITWHEEANQVVAKMDRLGIVVLVCYLAFAFSRRWIFGHWFSGTELTVVALSFTAGVMLGRLLVIRRAVLQVLKTQAKLIGEEVER